jgi:predicted DNA-binding protein with PD1-like motif
MSREQMVWPLSRLLRHPGPVAPERFSILSDVACRTARVRLEPGQSLVDALDAAVRRMCDGEARAAAVTLLGGGFGPCVYCLAAADRSGHTVATYTPFRDAGAVRVLGGSATLGLALSGEPMVHCHAWFVDPERGHVAGGHLDTRATRIGGEGLVARIDVLGRLKIRQVEDPETNHAIFSPVGYVEARA